MGFQKEMALRTCLPYVLILASGQATYTWKATSLDSAGTRAGGLYDLETYRPGGCYILPQESHSHMFCSISLKYMCISHNVTGKSQKAKDLSSIFPFLHHPCAEH